MKHSLLRRRTETVHIHMNLAAAESLAIFFFLLGYPGVRLKVSEWIHLISFNFLLLQFVPSLFCSRNYPSWQVLPPYVFTSISAALSCLVCVPNSGWWSSLVIRLRLQLCNVPQEADRMEVCANWFISWFKLGGNKDLNTLAECVYLNHLSTSIYRTFRWKSFDILLSIQFRCLRW